MATFFANQPVVEENPYAAAEAGYKFGLGMRDAERRKKFEAGFAGLIDSTGNLDQRAFYEKAKADGYSPEQIREGMKYREDQLKLQGTIAQQDTTQRALGFDPLAGGRNNAQIGNTPEGMIPGQVKVDSPSMQGAGAPIGPSSIDPDKLRNPSEVGQQAPVAEAPAGVQQITPVTTDNKLESWFQKLKGMSKNDVKAVQKDIGLTGKDVDGKPGKLTKAALEQHFKRTASVHGADNVDFDRTGLVAKQGDYADETGGQVTVDAQSSTPASGTFTLPADNVGPDVFAPTPEDRRTFDQKFEDSYRKENSLAGRAGDLGASDSSDLTTWNPRDNGSNEFRQYSTALNDMLKSKGFASGTDYLKAVEQSVLDANTPPLPNEGLLAMGLEGQAKYRGELNTYIAARKKAEGLAKQAVLEERGKLTEYARKFGVDTQGSEKFNADMRGRRAGSVEGTGVVRTYTVSEAEKAIGDRTSAAYQDIVASKQQFNAAKTPDERYSAVMSAINASLKADNVSMNAENVVALLTSSGMVPTERAQTIRQLMSENPGGAMDAALRLIKTTLAEGDPAQAAKWFDQRISNVRGQLKLVGYDVLGEGGGPPKSGARKALESKAKAAKAKKNTRGTVD